MKIGFIGGGNMGSALLGGLIKSGYNPKEITVCELSESKRRELSETGANTTDDAAYTESISDIIVFAVKPNVIDGVLSNMKGFTNKIYISIAAGVTISHLERILTRSSVKR